MKPESPKLASARSQVCATDLSVKDIMTRDVHTLSPDDNLIDLARVLKRQGVRHIPIVDQKNQLIGLLTHRDLLRLSFPANRPKPLNSPTLKLNDIKLKDVMREERTCHIQSVSADSNLRCAAIHMAEKKIGCLPVVDKKGTLVGIVTEGDFVRFFTERA